MSVTEMGCEADSTFEFSFEASILAFCLGELGSKINGFCWVSHTSRNRLRYVWIMAMASGKPKAAGSPLSHEKFIEFLLDHTEALRSDYCFESCAVVGKSMKEPKAWSKSEYEEAATMLLGARECTPLSYDALNGFLAVSMLPCNLSYNPCVNRSNNWNAIWKSTMWTRTKPFP